ncbi:MAG: 50S ribosomal protein L30 [bacterium]|nr:50S ribosomal protein L30 [bacterium]
MTAAAAKTIRIRQTRSGIGYERTQKATLKALGLGKVGRVREVADNEQVRGMIKKIPHLVSVVDAEQG